MPSFLAIFQKKLLFQKRMGRYMKFCMGLLCLKTLFQRLENVVSKSIDVYDGISFISLWESVFSFVASKVVIVMLIFLFKMKHWAQNQKSWILLEEQRILEFLPDPIYSQISKQMKELNQISDGTLVSTEPTLKLFPYY